MGIDRDACIDATVTARAVCEERYGHRPGRMHRRHSYIQRGEKTRTTRIKELAPHAVESRDD